MRGLYHHGGTSGKDSRLNIPGLLQGLFLAFLAMFVFSTLLTLAIVVLEWQESAGVLRIFNYLSIAIGGFFVGKRCNSRIWLHGVLIGVGYLVILTWLHGELSLALSLGWLLRLLTAALAGMCGAIVGSLFAS